MTGLLYKNFRISFFSFLFMLFNSVLSSVAAIIFSVIARQDLIENPDGAGWIMIVFLMLYYFFFMLPSLSSGFLFEADENKTCCCFAMSVPQGGKGHVESKYWYILLMNLTVLLITFVTDTVCCGILNGSILLASALVLIFSWRLLLAAIEVPFLIRFGSHKGAAIKGLVLLCIALLVMLYFMFGDISWLLYADDPYKALMEWLQSGKVMLPLSLFPFLSIAAYWLSCKISVKLFRKGAENYEQ